MLPLCHSASSHVFAVPAPGLVFDFFFVFLASGLRGRMVYERGYLRSSLALGGRGALVGQIGCFREDNGRAGRGKADQEEGKTMNSSIQLWVFVFFSGSARQEQQQLASVMRLLKRPAGFGMGGGAGGSQAVLSARVSEKERD